MELAHTKEVQTIDILATMADLELILAKAVTVVTLVAPTAMNMGAALIMVVLQVLTATATENFTTEDLTTEDLTTEDLTTKALTMEALKTEVRIPMDPMTIPSITAPVLRPIPEVTSATATAQAVSLMANPTQHPRRILSPRAKQILAQAHHCRLLRQTIRIPRRPAVRLLAPRTQVTELLNPIA